MAELQTLRDANPIEEVIQADGIALEKGQNERYYTCPNHPGLTVDVEKGRYYWPDREESGDVFNWLMNRYFWEFKQALNFLTHRALLPADQRQRLILVVSQGQQEPDLEKNQAGYVPVAAGEFDPWSVQDRQVHAALHLAADYPGFEKLFSRSLPEVVDLMSYIPQRFIALVGRWDGDYCHFCYQDFDGSWQEPGMVFLAVEVGSDYQLIADKNSGLYCAKCVERFRSWRRAFELLADYLAHNKRG